jgi:DNA recombination protein RmuC
MAWVGAGLFALAAALLGGAWLLARSRGRPAADLLGALADGQRGLQGELSAAQRVLAELRGIEEGRARQMDRAAESLRRLEAVVAGSSSRGAAGENILARALGQLPPDLLEMNVAFGSRVVEYALRLPGGRLLPVDSKWSSAAPLERMAQAVEGERRRLAEQVARELRLRVREMARYLEPERTLGLAVMAVPDAVYETAPEVHGEAYRAGVLVAPYSMALPLLLALYRLAARFGGTSDARHTAERLRRLDETLRQAVEEVESRFSRALVQLTNARDALREQLTGAHRATSRLLEEADADPAGDAGRQGLPALAELTPPAARG